MTDDAQQPDGLNPPARTDPAARYSRQMLFEPFGPEAQRRLGRGRALLVGCGALGTVLADTLVRAGIGFLRICDRDYIELDNLQRQVLFDMADIEAGLPKAEAAVRKLRRINPDVTVEAAVCDVNPNNIERLARDVDILLDGTDNFETRFLINDLAVKTDRPWIYGAVIGATGLCMPIIPGQTPCLRCVFESAPPPEMNPTCDTAGVLAPAVKTVASFQAIEAMKLLAGLNDQVTRRLLNIDVWSGHLTAVNVQAAFESGQCPCCHRRRFDYLEGQQAQMQVTLCGRDAVQIQPPDGITIDFDVLNEKIARAVASTGAVTHNPFMLRAAIEDLTLTLFKDGRAIIKGTRDAARARSVYARFVGS